MKTALCIVPVRSEPEFPCVPLVLPTRQPSLTELQIEPFRRPRRINAGNGGRLLHDIDFRIAPIGDKAHVRAEHTRDFFRCHAETEHIARRSRTTERKPPHTKDCEKSTHRLDYTVKERPTETRPPRPHAYIVAESHMPLKLPPETDKQSDPESRDAADILPFRARRKEPTPSKQQNPPLLAGSEHEPLSTRALIGIGLFLIFLITSGVWLIDTLRDIGTMQDCAMQGRRNCGTISVPIRDR
jgi:hypothetical protein